MEKTTLDFKNKDNSRNQNTIQKINETKSKGNLSADKSSYQKSKWNMDAFLTLKNFNYHSLTDEASFCPDYLGTEALSPFRWQTSALQKFKLLYLFVLSSCKTQSIMQIHFRY